MNKSAWIITKRCQIWLKTWIVILKRPIFTWETLTSLRKEIVREITRLFVGEISNPKHLITNKNELICDLTKEINSIRNDKNIITNTDLVDIADDYLPDGGSSSKLSSLTIQDRTYEPHCHFFGWRSLRLELLP